MCVKVNNAFDRKGGIGRVDVYLLVIVVGNLLATGAACAGVMAIGVVDFFTFPPDWNYF
jgi:hypothetical protein